VCGSSVESRKGKRQRASLDTKRREKPMLQRSTTITTAQPFGVGRHVPVYARFILAFGALAVGAAFAATGCAAGAADDGSDTASDEGSPDEIGTTEEGVCSNYTSRQCGVSYCPHHRVDYHYSCAVQSGVCVCHISSKSCYPWIGC